MKSLCYILFVLFVILNSCSSRHENNTPSKDEFTDDVEKLNRLDGKIKLSATVGGWKFEDTKEIIYVGVTIENLTGDTMRFLSWTCSYEYMFVVDDSMNFKIRSRNDCFSNVPMFIYLPPYMKTDRYLMIERWNERLSEKIRIGMKLYVQKKELEPGKMIANYANIKEDTIIWSDSIDLDRLYKDFYK